MRTAVIAFVTCVALVTSVIAGPRKVLVLPLDGNAPAAQRTKINESVVKLAKSKLDGDVTVGDTTFSETAAAVGCDPSQPACADTVRTTLQVDELVYGSAKTEDGTTTVTVNRVTSSGDPKAQITVIAETDDGTSAESGLEPGFTTTTASTDDGATNGSGSGSAEPPRAKRSNFFDTRERKLGVAFGAGGVLGLVIGIAYWSSASDLEDQIDSHPDETLAQIEDLKALEDKAASRALWGNVFFVVGLAATGIGGYFLWKDHKNRRSAVITPAPVEGGGMTFVLGGRW
jgi:hypothetical protein